MNRRDFLASVSLLAAASCARDGARMPRYDEHECPFCSTDKGTCSYCKGSKKCSFCKGNGKRRVVVDNRLNGNLRNTSYEEPCPFCGEKGVCRYCSGTGVCWACGGTGRIDSWDFYSRARAIDSNPGKNVR